MQKDFHFYVTYFLARKAGIPDARKIAWSNQYTDDLTAADLHGLQTQCKPLGNWSDKQIQISVLVPFHFIPGKEWVVTPNNSLARSCVEQAETPFGLGIALHALQDTFSHQGWTGFEEERNACDKFWYPTLERLIPNIGHADMRATPDVIDRIWTDPRTGKLIVNKERALECAKVTYSFLREEKSPSWLKVMKELIPVFSLKKYDDRKDALRKLAGGPRYSKLTYEKNYKNDFISAARKHLARVMEKLGTHD